MEFYVFPITWVIIFVIFSIFTKKTIDVPKLTLVFLGLLVVMFFWSKVYANDYYNQFAEVECLCTRQPNIDENGKFVAHYTIDQFDYDSVPTFEEEFNSIVQDHFAKKDKDKKKNKDKNKDKNPPKQVQPKPDENTFENSSEDEIDTVAYHKKKAEFHRRESDRTYANVIRACQEVRDIDQQKIIDTCFKIAAMTCGGIILRANPTSAFLAALTNAFVDYGLENYKAYPYIRTQSNWCEYHTELAEFHEEILVNYKLR